MPSGTLWACLIVARQTTRRQEFRWLLSGFLGFLLWWAIAIPRPTTIWAAPALDPVLGWARWLAFVWLFVAIKPMRTASGHPFAHDAPARFWGWAERRLAIEVAVAWLAGEAMLLTVRTAHLARFHVEPRALITNAVAVAAGGMFVIALRMLRLPGIRGLVLLGSLGALELGVAKFGMRAAVGAWLLTTGFALTIDSRRQR